jgi:hypothetical protein
MSTTIARHLLNRITELEARLQNDYETLSATILQLDAYVSRLEVELARATHARSLSVNPSTQRSNGKSH